ncbi:MAG: class I SAM-dependent methyltransferase, partial [Candidatus Taylorbacteria bacterium]|nr:class I SAM-dependent methyltransferase [Candidatus Taylorbacteria bacterium]
MNKKETSWNGVADWYDELLESSGDSFQAKVILPNLLRVLDIKPGIKPPLKILDVACGQGYFSRALEAAGADVTGADVSNELIEIAKERAIADGRANRVDFHVASADALTFAESGTFDAAIIILSLQNIENLSGT